MGMANGMHHCAIAVRDVDAAIKFFTEAVGAPMKAFYWMHGREQCFHIFFELSESSTVAIAYNPNAEQITPPAEHRGAMGEDMTPGNMEHIALNVDSLDDLMAMRDRLRSNGYVTLGPIDHQFCQSVYVPAAIDGGMSIEFATWTGGMSDANFDATCYEEAGYSASDIERFKNPAPFEGQGGLVENPELDSNKQKGLNPQVAATLTNPEIHAGIVEAMSEAI